MEKIKLSNGKQFSIITNGISSSNDSITIKLLPETTSILEIDSLFSTSGNTEKMFLLSDEDEVLKTYNGYIQNVSCEIKKNVKIGYNEYGEEIMGNLVIVEMTTLSDTEARIAALETSQADQDTAIMDLATAIGGEE